MWGQSWANVYDLVYTPDNPNTSSGIDLTKILEEKNIDEIEMMEIAENFFHLTWFPSTSRNFLGEISFFKTTRSIALFVMHLHGILMRMQMTLE